MFAGYLVLGGTEVFNQDLTYTLVEGSDCPAGWIRCEPCPGLTAALGDTPNDLIVENAPWYDAEDPATHRFYGFYPVEIEGIEGSTRTATLVEGISDGGVVQGTRKAIREIRARGVMIGRGHDALDAGLAWLDAVLDGDQCSTHPGGGCGEVDACYFISCPPARPTGPDGSPVSDAEYDLILDPLRRRMHGVTAISGPIVLSHFGSGGYHAFEVEFTLAAATPYIFSLPKRVELSPTTPEVVQDTPFNLVPYPSAELPGSPIVVATNYSINPSVETNDVGWSVAAGGGITGAMVTGARVSEISAVGSWAYRARFVATGASAVTGWFGAQQTVALPTAAGQRFSVNLWANTAIEAGTITAMTTEFRVFWRNAANAVLREDLFGTKTGPGATAATVRSVAPPAGTTQATVQARLVIPSWPAGAILRLYADALAVTVP